MRKTFVVLFAVILAVPAVLGILSACTGWKADVPLNGYTDVSAMPELTLETYADGSFQSGLGRYYEQELKPRGVMIRTYCSLLYDFFKTGKKIVGKNNDLFETSYINYELCLPPARNCVDQDDRDLIDKYLRELNKLRKKLAAVDKALVVCLCPSKANFHADNIPSSYTGMAPAERLSAAEYFCSQIRDTSIPVILCRDMKDSLEYPAFYTTGIHWSRPFEQTVTQQLLEKLRRLTGKDYPMLELGDIRERSAPYWRDADVYDILNVWEKPRGPYYEYEEWFTEGSDPLRLLIQGTSFSHGFLEEFRKMDPEADVFYISRKNYYRDRFGEAVPIDDYSDIDLARVLDRTDAVVIESIEADLPSINRSFVRHLINFLDTYEPGEAES